MLTCLINTINNLINIFVMGIWIQHSILVTLTTDKQTSIICSGARVIASRILHEICLLYGELAITRTNLTLIVHLGAKSDLLIKQYAIRTIANRHTTVVILIRQLYSVTIRFSIFQKLVNESILMED